MAIEAQLADGRILEFPDGTDPSVIQATVKRIVAQSSGPKQSTIGSELVRGGKQLVSSARTGIGSIFDPVGAAKAGVARSEDIGQEAGEGVSLEAVKKAYRDKGLLSAAGEAVSQVPRALAGQGANLASMYAGAKAGSAAGSAFGIPGRAVGAALGTGAVLLPQFMGSNVERQAEEQMDAGKEVDIDRKKAYTSAAFQAALEGGGTALTLGKRVVGGILGLTDDVALKSVAAQAELVKAAERSLAASAGRGVVRGAAEMPVEVAQQVIERYQAGLELTSPDAYKEYGESAYQAALIGGPLGGAAGVAGRGQARDQLDQQRRAEEAARPREPEPEQAPEQKIVPGAKLRQDARVGTQGTLFTRKEMGDKIAKPKEAPEPKVAAVQQGEQLGLGLDFQREYNDLAAEREALRAGPRTADVRARIAELTEQMASYDEATAGQQQAEEIIKAERAAKKAKTAVAEPPVVEPPVTGITQADIDAIGLPLRTSAKWVQDNVLGKTVDEIKALVQRDPKLISGKGARAEVLKALIAPQPTAFEEKPNVPTPTQTDQPQGELDLGGGEPSVGVPSKPASTDVVQPGTGVSAPTGTSAAPDGLGLAPAGQPAGTGTAPQGTQPTAVITTPTRTSDQVQDEIRAIQKEQQSLLTRAGRVPAVKSPARKKWDALEALFAQKMAEWDALDKAERKAKNAPTTTPAVTPPPATTTTAKGPKTTAKPTATTTPPKETKAPAPAVATETVDEEAARKAEAEEIKRRLDEVERKQKEAQIKADAAKGLPPAPTPKATPVKAAPKVEPEVELEIPDAFAGIGQAAAEARARREAREKAAEDAKQAAEELKAAAAEAKKAAAEIKKAAAEAKKAAAAPAQVPDEIKKVAEKLKGTVLYQGKEGFIVKAPDRSSGEAAYIPVSTTANYFANRLNGKPLNIDAIKGDVTGIFTQKDFDALKVEAAKLEKIDADNYAKFPNGPFTGAKSNVVAGDSIDPRYTNYLTELMKSLGLGDVRVFLYHGEDVRGRENDLHLHGNYYPIMSRAYPDEGQEGATRTIGPNDKDFMLFINNNMSVENTLETISHELGHMIQQISYNNAPAATKRAVQDEYDAWVASLKGKTIADLIPKLRNRYTTEDMEARTIPDIPLDKMRVSDLQYWMGFSEWFADNVSRWATTSDKPLTITEKFFSKVGQMMRDLVALVTSRKFPPAKTVANFLDAMGPNSSYAWFSMRGGPPTITPQTSTAPETSAFEKWFGDSKVVDENGEPLVVYTGTSKDKDFDTFRIPKNGAWFITDPAAASQYAVENDSMGYKWDTGRPVATNTAARVLPVYLRIENPYTLTEEETKELRYSGNYKRTQGIIFERAKAKGHDGIDLGDGVWVVIKDPNQIKSATGNRGTYSTESPKIQNQVSFSTEKLVDSMGPLSRDEESSLKRLIAGVQSSPDIGYVTKFRTQVTDIAATIEKRLSDKFDGAVRNSLGELNPMGLYRQAQDYTKMLLEYFQTGTLYKDPTTGLWKSGLGEGVRPPAEVFALIDEYAAKNGYSRERATQIASRVLEGVRLNEMRRSNRQDGTAFVIHLADNEIDQLVAEYNADPDLKEMSKLMDEARIEMVNNMVKVGRLSAEEGKLWREVVGYVPFDRETIDAVASNFNKAKKISGKGLAQLGKLPELVGSLKRPVGNVFENYLNTLGWMVGQTLKADATLQTLKSLQDVGYAKKLGISSQNNPNVIGAYVDGELVYWAVPSKYDVMAFKDLNPPKAGWLRLLGAFSNILRKAVTALPPFALKQVADDVQRAILTSGVKNPGALIWMSLTNFPKLAFAELRGIQHPMVRDFGRLGLTGEYDFEAGKPAASLLKDLGYKKRGRFESLLHKLDGITRASDLAVRKAIYDQTMNESKDELLAQTRAREFINFRRRGSNDFVGAMVTTIPFFNAYIQGMDVLYRAASGKDSSSSVDRAQARQLFWSRAAIATTFSIMYALGKDDDDEDYNEMDLRTRDSNWIFPGGYKLGVPGELGAIFKVIPERVVEYMKRQGTPEEQTAFDAMRTTLSYMFEQYLGRAVPVPQAIKPVLEAWANKSFLTGKDLEGYHHRAMDPSMRKTEQTSELAKAIAVFSRDEIGVEVSPIMIDNALRGYLGSTAAMFTMVTDSLLNPTRVDRPLHKYALFSNYLYDPVGTRRMTEFYEEREKVGKANTTLNELMKTDIARAEKYIDEHSDELQLEGAVNSTLEQLERTRAYRKFLNSPDGAEEMSKEDREAELKEIKKVELELVSWVREAKAELRKVQR